MHKALMEARRKFRGQKGSIKTGYERTIFPEGKYTCEMVSSELKEITMSGEKILAHCTGLKIVLGEYKGKRTSTFPNDMSDEDGILSCAKNIAAILGDVVPGKDVKGEFMVDYDDFIKCVEDLVPTCVGEYVEITIKNGKKNRPDGTPYQNTYINRGLGSDAKAILAGGDTPSSKELFEGDDLNMGGKKKVAKKKAVKKVAKKKVAKKKVVKRK